MLRSCILLWWRGEDDLDQNNRDQTHYISVLRFFRGSVTGCVRTLRRSLLLLLLLLLLSLLLLLLSFIIGVETSLGQNHRYLGLVAHLNVRALGKLSGQILPNY